ncbi:IclR family transcriptional regulator [Streptacidiphilus jiangxiensis]|uniref:Glycerol operon regulatory protein n=1 Tax=Streptacidiphilus jiangxiensis TaxID=235985 RepID=A0A1H7TBJ4_STRJI|nr:IclR family transcriptional regulator [Streptacidiphilus jiangxiensis]SEL82242.1 DNA-binding transcriptional regulator, IclR family [Streptacidiphilus jiangxiensis]
MTSTSAPAGAQAVTRALGLLQCFHDNAGALSVSELARRMGLSVSTTHRLARTLVAADVLEQDEQTARYRIGPLVAELGQLSLHQRGMHRAAPELADLSRSTGATADLAIRGGDHAVILVGGSVNPATGLGLRRPLHSTALGKVLLAWARPGEGDLRSLPMPALTDRTITDPVALEEELGRVRERGYALNDGESVHGVRTLAVPVLEATGHVHAALALRSTPDVLTDDRLPWFLAHARSCARALEVLLLPPQLRHSALPGR